VARVTALSRLATTIPRPNSANQAPSDGGNGVLSSTDGDRPRLRRGFGIGGKHATPIFRSNCSAGFAPRWLELPGRGLAGSASG
jgi:hypothetical protein